MISSVHDFVFRLSEQIDAMVSRRGGARVREMLLELDRSLPPERRIVILIEDRDLLTPSFADECIARLASTVGIDRFQTRFKIDANRVDTRTLINGVVRNRLILDRLAKHNV